MIFTQNLSIKEKFYLVEMFNKSKFCQTEITPETLNSLKPGVLQVILDSIKIDPRKRKILNKILDKINYYGILKEGELAPAKVFIENKQEE